MRGDLEKWVTAGKIAQKVLEKSLEIVEPGTPLLEIAERLESEIVARGGAPAFPVNISVNSVAAHYSPPVGDEKTVPQGSIVKIDVGVHVDGFIADTALTVSFKSGYAPLLTAASTALRSVLKTIRAGVELGELGRVVEACAQRFSLKPIANLSGHSILPYRLHAGKSVPNTYVKGLGEVKAGEIYAIEPFITDGAGYVTELQDGYIYSVTSTRRTGDPALDQLLKQLWGKYRGLPFSERWVYREAGQEGLASLKRLAALGRVYVYPVLVERRGGAVSQFEDTVIVTREGVINTTNVLTLV